MGKFFTVVICCSIRAREQEVSATVQSAMYNIQCKMCIYHNSPLILYTISICKKKKKIKKNENKAHLIYTKLKPIESLTHSGV